MKKLGLRIKRLLFPPRCSACGALLDWYTADETAALCKSCLSLWENEELETCGRCAKRVRDCACMTEELLRAGCLGYYKLLYYHPGKEAQIQNRVIYHIKESRDQKTPAFLAARLQKSLQTAMRTRGVTEKNMILTYVPRGRSAKREHGVDQAKELARELSGQTGIGLRTLLKRTGRTRHAQKSLNREQRRKNASAAYRLAKEQSLTGKTVVLVDDVVTTGTSMAACIRLLYRAGAAGVIGLSVASDDVNRDSGLCLEDQPSHRKSGAKSREKTEKHALFLK